jgi:hypothetical protein
MQNMKKKLLLLLTFLFAVSGCADLHKSQLQDEDLYDQMREGGAKWSDYGELASGSIADGDDFLIRDVSDFTFAATGTQKRYTWASMKADLEAGLNIVTTETDPIVGAVDGTVCADGAGNIAACSDATLSEIILGGIADVDAFIVLDDATTSKYYTFASLKSDLESYFNLLYDPIGAGSRFTNDLTMGSFSDGDETPDVTAGGTGIDGNDHFWQTANTGATTITNFDDGDDHSEFADGDWFVLRCDDSNTTIDCTSNANFVCPTETDFTCSSSLPRVIGWQYSGTKWHVMFGIGPGESSPGVYAVSAMDLGGGVLEIPNGASPTVDATGELALDTTSDQIQYYGASSKRAISPKLTYSIVVPSVAATDDFLFVKLPYGVTATSLDCIVSAATSATINIQECSATGTDCTDMATADLVCDTDGANTTTFNNATADSGDWLKLDVASISGTPGTLTVTFTYNVVAD